MMVLTLFRGPRAGIIVVIIVFAIVVLVVIRAIPATRDTLAFPGSIAVLVICVFIVTLFFLAVTVLILNTALV